MKFRAWIAGAALGATVCQGVLANHPPPMERPTPPPCCADGICYPNPVTWGHYPTRWRRWPGDYVEPALPPQFAPPPPLPADVPRYDAPPPEDEDRRAPPPTAPRAAPPTGPEQPITEPGITPPDETPPAAPPMTVPPVVPPTAPFQPQPGLPFGEPAENGFEQPAPAPLPFSEPPPTTLPFGGEPPTTLPFGEPMGDADPPPAPPFRLKPTGQAPGSRAAATPAARPQSQPAAPPRRDDRPAAIPIAMSNWSN